VNGNSFYNYGTINVNGAYNWIDMGGPQAAIPSLNPLPFYNYGTIDFQDGEADDYLLITGDFAGEGDINVDVSGANEVSDVLYIDGSVVTGTVQTINVDLLDLPDQIETEIPMVYVSGISVASNFVLGDVDWDENNSFVTLDFSLIADIDATNATPDVFSLGIEVTGLSDPGTLVASLPNAVHSLMSTQVGTWRQRMGVIDSFNKGAVALWARVFHDKGSFSPDHEAFNFGNGGNFDWDQTNSGVEAGIDFAVTDEFSLGLLVAKSDADTHLDSPGVGHAEIDAETWGVYGTWISPNGFYLDASYRWMDFDVDLSSVAGNMDGQGDAESFNIEIGYAWTLSGGLKIEPQLQYTKTNVDNLDVFETTTGMSFHNEGGDSSRGRLGIAFRKSFGEADAGWMWTPYVTISAVREFDGENAYAINNTFFGVTSIEGTSALLELGFTARHQNWAVYGGLNWQDGGAVNSFFGGQLGVRYTFGGPAPAPAPVAPPPAKTCADLDDDGDGINNCDDKCLGSTAGQAVGPDGCPVPQPEPEPVMEPKPFRG
jgi:outer membrane autotransporter protein